MGGLFWRPRLRRNREGNDWLHVFKTLVCYRLIDPGSEWRLPRQWCEWTAALVLDGGYGFYRAFGCPVISPIA